MSYIVGIMAMVFGFVSQMKGQYDSATGCFAFALVLWIVSGIFELIERS